MELMCFLPVRALPKPERLRYLFSFDFDDTLFTLGGPAEERSIFFRTMRMLRSQYGVLWGVNTGRDPVYLREGLADMFRDDAEAFAPDFTVTMERNVHLADVEGRLMPGAAWNDDCAVAHDSLFTRYGGMLESLIGQLESRFSGLGLRRQDNDAFSLVVPAAWMKFPASFRIRLVRMRKLSRKGQVPTCVSATVITIREHPFPLLPPGSAFRLPMSPFSVTGTMIWTPCGTCRRHSGAALPMRRRK